MCWRLTIPLFRGHVSNGTDCNQVERCLPTGRERRWIRDRIESVWENWDEKVIQTARQTWFPTWESTVTIWTCLILWFWSESCRKMREGDTYTDDCCLLFLAILDTSFPSYFGLNPISGSTSFAWNVSREGIIERVSNSWDGEEGKEEEEVMWQEMDKNLMEPRKKRQKLRNWRGEMHFLWTGSTRWMNRRKEVERRTEFVQFFPLTFSVELHGTVSELVSTLHTNHTHTFCISPFADMEQVWDCSQGSCN